MHSRNITIVTTTSTFGYSGFPERWRVIHNPLKRKLTEDEVEEFLKAERPLGMIAGVEPLTERVLATCPSLAVISRCGAGIDSVDLVAANKLGIMVYSTPHAPVPSVAEHAITLMLCLLKRVAACDQSVRRRSAEKPTGSLLGAKTVGIVGCGRIGTRVAEIATAFGCRVIGYDPMLHAHRFLELCALNELLSRADVISIHVPLTKGTKHLIDESAFRLMKEDAILINTARGGIVDERALFEALQKGQIGGTGLDVFENEPYEGPLARLGSRVILTPHVASRSKESRLEMEREAVANLARGLQDSQRSAD